MLSKFIFLSTFAAVSFIGLTAEEVTVTTINEVPPTTEIQEGEKIEAIQISANDDKNLDDTDCTGCEKIHAPKNA